MIEFSFKGVAIRVKFMFLSIITLFLIMDKTGIATFTLLASLIHELGHVIVLILIDHKPKELIFEIVGIKLVQPNKTISYIKEILVLLAGPMANIIMFLLLNYIFSDIYFLNVFSFTHLFIGLFNLLPIGGLDGGKILNLLFKLKFNDIFANIVAKTISIMIIIPVIFISLYLFIFKHNFSLMTTSIYLLFMVIFNKYD